LALQNGQRLASKDTVFLPRAGRHYARKIVPPELRAIIGKNELRELLGGVATHAVQGPFADCRLRDARFVKLLFSDEPTGVAPDPNTAASAVKVERQSGQ